MLLASLSLVLGLCTLYLDFASSYSACGETSSCAREGPPLHWLGRVFTDSGQPAPNATVNYTFGSMESPEHDLGVVSVRTDEAGRYCLLWPAESVGAIVSANTPTPSTLPPDSRIQDLAARTNGPLILTEPHPHTSPDQDRNVPGETADSRLWSAPEDATVRCSRASPPWYRIDQTGSNWRAELIFYLGLIAIGLSVASWFTRRRPTGAVLARVSVAPAVAGVVLWILVWVTHTI